MVPANSNTLVESQLFTGASLRIGRWLCSADCSAFPVTDPLHNDLVVFVHEPLWWNRGGNDWAFLEPGSVVMHRRGMAICRRAVTAAGDRAEFVAVEPDVFDEVLHCAGVSPRRVTTMLNPIIPHPAIGVARTHLVTALDRGECNGLGVEEYALSIFAAVSQTASGLSLRPTARRGTQVGHRRLVDRARACVQANLAVNQDLTQIAKQVGTSAFHLSRTFREQTGLTLANYRLQQRVRAAVDLIRTYPQDLATLAAELGFSSHSHLTRSFQRFLGVPPSALNDDGVNGFV